MVCASSTAPRSGSRFRASAAPTRRFDSTDIGDPRIGFLALQRKDGGGRTPPRHHQLATVGLVSDNRGGVVWEDPVRRRLPPLVGHGARPFADPPPAFLPRIM